MANRFKDAKVEKPVKFMGLDIGIRKMSVSQVTKVQELAKSLVGSENDMDNMKILILVCQQGAPELRDLTDEDMNDFPVEELTNLSNEIMIYSGLQPAKPVVDVVKEAV